MCTELQTDMSLAEFILSQGGDNPEMMETILGKVIVDRAKEDYERELRNHFDSHYCKLSTLAKGCIDKAVRYNLRSDFINQMRSDFVSEFGYESTE